VSGPVTDGTEAEGTVKLEDLDESMTSVPVDAARASIEGDDELGVLPVHDQERGTACLLIATSHQLWIACRARGDSQELLTVDAGSVPWREVAIGPFGVVGRVPGGFLGGPEASDHILTVLAGDRVFEARLAGERGMDAVEAFASVALHAGAQDHAA